MARFHEVLYVIGDLWVKLQDNHTRESKPSRCKCDLRQHDEGTMAVASWRLKVVYGWGEWAHHCFVQGEFFLPLLASMKPRGAMFGQWW